jgi:protein subunit release factor A
MQHLQEIENCQKLGEEEKELVEEARKECLALESDKVEIENEIREIIVPEEKTPEHSDMLLEIKSCKTFDLLSRRWWCGVFHFC